MSFSQLKNKYSSGKIHFIGIGGIGMSAIALILQKIGCQVQGSDLSSNANTKALEAVGVKCFVGHKEENITDDVILVVETSIVKPTNPEFIKAKANNIPIIRRADMLAQIMAQKKGITVSGTHGKTSTTGMIAVLLESAGFDPMVINGGIINHFGSNAKFGDGDFVVAESDESDASFVDLPSFIGVVNNIEPEHLEFYGGDFELVKNYYKRYVEQVPVDGLVAMCIDDSEVKKLYNELSKTQKNLVSLSIKDENADYFGFNISLAAAGLKFDVKYSQPNDNEYPSFLSRKESGCASDSEHRARKVHIIKDIKMPAYGIHNVKNALAPVAIGIFLNLSEEQIKQGLMNYSGVKRRFTKTGEVNGITIIDDYGHHPTEIKAVFSAARAILPNHKLIVVFQPHKYTRTRDLFNEFCNAFVDVDVAIIADIYSAGQDPIVGINSDILVEGIKKTGHKNVLKLNSQNDFPNDLSELIKLHAKSGDMVICVGAGSVSNWANILPQKLKEIL